MLQMYRKFLYGSYLLYTAWSKFTILMVFLKKNRASFLSSSISLLESEFLKLISVNMIIKQINLLLKKARFKHMIKCGIIT